MPHYKHRPELRMAVLEMLSTLPLGRRAPAEFIRKAVNELGPHGMKPEETQSVLSYLRDEALIVTTWNENMDRDEWELTPRGRVTVANQ